MSDESSAQSGPGPEASQRLLKELEAAHQETLTEANRTWGRLVDAIQSAQISASDRDEIHGEAKDAVTAAEQVGRTAAQLSILRHRMGLEGDDPPAE
jgi:hypothetical protein